MEEFSVYHQLRIFVFSSIFLSVDNLEDFISLDLLEPLDLCEPLDSFEFTLSLSLLLLMHEYFDEHWAFCAIFLSQKWTFFLKEQTWEPTFSNQSSYLSVSSSSCNWLYSWCTSNKISTRSFNCNYHEFCRAICKSNWKKYIDYQWHCENIIWYLVLKFKFKTRKYVYNKTPIV